MTKLRVVAHLRMVGGGWTESLVSQRLNSLRKKSLNLEEVIPQWLKPDLFANTYVRAEARTLQKPEFFREL